MKKYILVLACCCFSLALNAQDLQNEENKKIQIQDKETQESQKQATQTETTDGQIKNIKETNQSTEDKKDSPQTDKQVNSKAPKSKDSAVHYKGKWSYTSKTEFRGFKGSFSDKKDAVFIGDILPYQAGVVYNILDDLKIYGYIGLALETSEVLDSQNNADNGLNITIPIEVTLGYSITNFLNYKKNIEVYVGLGYDQGIYDFLGDNLISKFYGDIGISFGKIGFQLYYAPYAKSGSYVANANTFGASFVFRWN